MKLLNIFKSFKNDESGAVTVDWVVLTGAVVGLGILVLNTVGGAMTGQATAIANQITGPAGNDAGAGDPPAGE